VVVLSLATLVAVNAAARVLLSRAGSNLAYRLMDEKWRIVGMHPVAVQWAAAGSDSADSGTRPWLILGDSAGNQGADPETIAAALTTDPEHPATALNLCVVADALAVHDAWILSAWIDRHGPPAGVVIVHTYDMWHREANHPEHTNSAAMLARAPVSPGRATPPVRFTGPNLATYLAVRHAPLYAENESLASLIAEPGRTIGRLRDRGDIAWQWPRADGFMPTPATRAGAVERDTRGHLNLLRGNRARRPLPARLSPDNLAALGAIGALAEQHGFDVYLAAAPMHRGLWEAPRLQAYHATLRAALAEIDAAHERVHIALAEPVRFEANQMQNADHVALPAAIEYSRTLGEAIRAMREEGE
jgi:hypothetical protein